MESPKHLNKDTGKDGLDYPINLDVVTWKNDPYQVVAMAQTGVQEKDIFVVRYLVPDSETFRINGARFVRFDVTKDPPDGEILKRDEGVRLTGELVEGEREE